MRIGSDIPRFQCELLQLTAMSLQSTKSVASHATPKGEWRVQWTDILPGYFSICRVQVSASHQLASAKPILS